jgi:1,4-dihydroxy-2-naphthoyl-CoA synthase
MLFKQTDDVTSFDGDMVPAYLQKNGGAAREIFFLGAVILHKMHGYMVMQ